MSEKPEKVIDKPELIKPAKRGPKKGYTLDDKEILRLYNDGWNISRIARKMSVVPNAIRYHLKKMGVIK